MDFRSGIGLDSDDFRHDLERAMDGFSENCMVVMPCLEVIRRHLNNVEQGNRMHVAILAGVSRLLKADLGGADNLEIARKLKAEIDSIVQGDVSGFNSHELAEIRNILSMSASPHHDYQRLEVMGSHRESKIAEYRNAGGLFGKRLACDHCRKKRKASEIMVCHGCGMFFCEKCGGVGCVSECPNGDNYGSTAFERWFNRQ